METMIESPQTAQSIYEAYVKPLAYRDKLELIALISWEMAQEGIAKLPDEVEAVPVKPKRKITELRGLGKEIWQEIDTDAYIREMRDEWDQKR